MNLENVDAVQVLKTINRILNSRTFPCVPEPRLEECRNVQGCRTERDETGNKKSLDNRTTRNATIPHDHDKTTATMYARRYSNKDISYFIFYFLKPTTTTAPRAP